LARLDELLGREGVDTGCSAAGPSESEVAELRGVRARVISLPALKADEAELREDPIVAAKDRADLAALSLSR
jgi:hypothetical protein